MKREMHQQTAKIYRFPHRRLGDAAPDRSGYRNAGGESVKAPAIVSDGWYHEAAIMEAKVGKG